MGIGRIEARPRQGMKMTHKSQRGLVMIDMVVTASSPAGSCVRTILQGLAQRMPITLFSGQWDAPAGCEAVQFEPVRYKSRWPVAFRYMAFHWSVARRVKAWRQAGGRAVLTQATQGQLVGADIVYAHFCHGAYLPRLLSERRWADARFWLRVLTHWFNAREERMAFDAAKVIVAPSQGLKRELMAHYKIAESRIEVIANAVDIGRFGVRPDDFDRAAWRVGLKIAQDQTVMAFMALGDFERKGLSQVLDALSRLQRDAAKFVVVVIGGQGAEIDSFKSKAAALGVGDCMRFVGMQSDVRPYLWAADLFAFPSLYEIFSLAILQAAAAGLPVMVTQGLYGAEEFVTSGVNGWLVPRDGAAISGLFGQIARGEVDLAQMGQAARQSVEQYSAQAFVSRWVALYKRLGLEAVDV